MEQRKLLKISFIIKNQNLIRLVPHLLYLSMVLKSERYKKVKYSIES